MATPHINAKSGAFAETCLLPGDPLRAQYVAEKFLENAELVTDVRNMFGYTGTYKGKRISIMGSGMGIPSASIYYKELITEYGVKNLIRVGSAGAISKDVKVRDVVIGMGACTDSNVNRMRFKGFDFAAIADFSLLEKAVAAARTKGSNPMVGNLFSADLFYNPDPTMFDCMEKHGVYGVEMEAAGLYGVCAEFGAKGLAICTISDHIRTGEALDAEARQNSFDEMIEIALESALL
ncbi:purine-nucleoside phosphorylase [Pelagibaculum spongiae]|uniref:Purine nucleoside phosphorylase DeoD-type n=1 Tax=Pelagibaculum spongiae TaxID=2080658 RepID=A0A2V1GUF6_9GAMM|nr:purine-nucleoside phosphorylase [Pelagibaculum spongiae]PVZ69716.1 purine-nucleoside phosphorylase [Pelagibaculum spongiae]